MRDRGSPVKIAPGPYPLIRLGWAPSNLVTPLNVLDA